MTSLATRLRGARIAKGLGLRELAREVDVNHSFLSGVEAGTKTGLSGDLARKIAKVLGVTAEHLVGATGKAVEAANVVRLAPPPHDVRLVEHARIHASPLNPRKRFDPEAILGLAASIAAEGLLQNLVVRPHPTRPGDHELAAGERRWRAIGLLIEDGRWPADRPVPVKVRELTDYQLLKLGAAENVEREDMHPLEEGEAFAALVDMAEAGDGATEQLAKDFGRTQRWVQLRIALARKLAPATKAAFLAGKINLEAARAFTLGDQKTQASVLKGNPRAGENVGWVRHQMTAKMIPVGRAHFPPDAYSGEIAGEGDERYFVDVAQFIELQSAAIAETVGKLQKKWAWVERIDGHAETWRYGKSKDRKVAGAIVEVGSNHQVAIHTGLAKPAQAKARARAAELGLDLAPGEAPPPAPMDPYTQPHLAEAKRRKTAAMQTAVLRSGPFRAMQLTCLALLGGERAVRIRAEPPGQMNQGLATAVRDALLPFADALEAKVVTQDAFDRTPLKVGGGGYLGHERETKLWHQITALSFAAVEKLFVALVAARVGSFNDYKPEIADTPAAAAIAATLEVTHGAAPEGEGAFVLDADWLAGYRKPALIEAGIGTGVYQPADKPAMGSLTAPKLKAEILGSPLRDRKWIPPELEFQAAEMTDRHEDPLDDDDDQEEAA